MFGRRYQRLELILEDLEIGQRYRVTEMDDLEEQQSIVCNMSDVDFERRFLVMENHLAHLVELFPIGANANINQRQKKKKLEDLIHHLHQIEFHSRWRLKWTFLLLVERLMQIS